MAPYSVSYTHLSAEYVDWVTEVMKDAGKEVMLDMPPEHATGGTDYYVPYVQHLWEPSYVPPTRNDVIAERLSCLLYTSRCV